MLQRSVSLALVLTSFLGVLALCHPALAREARHAAMIIDGNTGAVLHDEDGDELRHPASLTKMMTLYLTFETIESGRMSMSDSVKISQEAASQAPSKLELEPGEEISVSDAIRAVITKSANDVAVALAEKIGGSERNFVRLMNTRAREIGMTKTHFENASGLPNEDQVTTARDMVTLGLRLQDDFPAYYPLFATRAFTYNGATHRNHNTMLNSFQGIDGIKTGYTSASGFNLVTSVRRGGRHLVGAVFGGESAATRNGEMRVLLTKALTRASSVKSRRPTQPLIAKLKSAPKLAERPKPKDKAKIQVAEAAPVAPSAPLPLPKPFAAAKAAPQAMTAPVAAANSEVSDTSQSSVPAPFADPELAAAIAGPGAPIDVFKVKRVMVAPRQGPKRPPPSADQTTDMAPEETATAATAGNSAPQLPPEAAPFKVASAGAAEPAHILAQTFVAGDAPLSSETIVPKLTPVSTSAPARLPSPLDDKIAMLGARDADPASSPAVAPPPIAQTDTVAPAAPIAAAPVTAARQAVKAVASKPAALPQRTAAFVAQQARPTATVAVIERGRAPSSLQAQAAQLPLTPPQRAASLGSGPASGEAASRFEIQIGAYGSIDEAQKALTSAQSRAGKLLVGYASVTHPVQKAGRQVIRARFTGFDSARAASTCTELRRQAIDCFVMTAE